MNKRIIELFNEIEIYMRRTGMFTEVAYSIVLNAVEKFNLGIGDKEKEDIAVMTYEKLFGERGAAYRNVCLERFKVGLYKEMEGLWH